MLALCICCIVLLIVCLLLAMDRFSMVGLTRQLKGRIAELDKDFCRACDQLEWWKGLQEKECKLRLKASEEHETDVAKLNARIEELEADAITSEWQDSIRNILVDACREAGIEDADSIDGSGTDAGPFELTEAEVQIGSNMLVERIQELQEQLQDIEATQEISHIVRESLNNPVELADKEAFDFGQLLVMEDIGHVESQILRDAFAAADELEGQNKGLREENVKLTNAVHQLAVNKLSELMKSNRELTAKVEKQKQVLDKWRGRIFDLCDRVEALEDAGHKALEAMENTRKASDIFERNSEKCAILWDAILKIDGGGPANVITRQAIQACGEVSPTDHISHLKDRLNELEQLTEKAGQHHRDKFGGVCLSMVSTKLAEETGELCGAIIRHLEKRDGRGWTDEMTAELRDVLVCLHVIASRLGRKITDESVVAVKEFASRAWDVEKVGAEA